MKRVVIHIVGGMPHVMKKDGGVEVVVKDFDGYRGPTQEKDDQGREYTEEIYEEDEVIR